jgi:hypothetical protein
MVTKSWSMVGGHGGGEKKVKKMSLHLDTKKCIQIYK